MGGKLSTHLFLMCRSPPPPYSILQAVFILLPHLPFTKTHLPANQGIDVISAASRGHRWTPASVSLRWSRGTRLLAQQSPAEPVRYRRQRREVTTSVSVRVHIQSLASQHAQLGKCPGASTAKGGATLRDLKNAFSSSACQCVSAGGGYLRWCKCRYGGFKAHNGTNPVNSGGGGVPDAEACEQHQCEFVTIGFFICCAARMQQAVVVFIQILESLARNHINFEVTMQSSNLGIHAGILSNSKSNSHFLF